MVRTKIPDDSISPDDKAAFLDKAITWLKQWRGFKIQELVYTKFRLRAALEVKIKEAKRHLMGRIHMVLFLNAEVFASDGRGEMIFEQGRYAYDRPYCGFVDLPKHFFPEIGNPGAEGEEFDCAVFLATVLEGVKYWVRNVERKPTSFSLQTATDKFYPDFICKLEDGRIRAVEYKNSRDYDLPGNEEKRRLGALWELRSSGHCLFVMPRGKDFEAIKAKLAK
ncbi:MAG TPA: hypothetical protein ENH01_06595 [Nitrospirae bacterium]|nr:hypothetical protein [Nitrospirota bacterium]